MKILDVERSVPVNGIRLIVTQNEAVGLMHALNWVLGDEARMDCVGSDDDDGHFVSIGIHGCDGDDF